MSFFDHSDFDLSKNKNKDFEYSTFRIYSPGIFLYKHLGNPSNDAFDIEEEPEYPTLINFHIFT